MSEVWAQWEGHLIDGKFPLLRCLGTSDHSGVFLTGHAGLPKAALKLMPAIPTLIEAQLAHWEAAAALPHPHLISLYERGRCQLGGRHFLFVVMEYAEQNLSEVLPHRALTADEAREMLVPTLEVLSFLHERHQVQGQLKPSNILVIGDQLKVASDTIRPAGDAPAHIGMPSVYDPPEAQSASSSTAADIWALGVTVVEALTRRPPSWLDEQRQEALLPADFPVAFSPIVRRCLSDEPTKRPGVAELLSWSGGLRGSAVPAPEPAGVPTAAPPADTRARAVSVAASSAGVAEPLAAGHGRYELQTATQRRPLLPMIVGAVVLLVAGWAAVHLFSSRRADEQAPAEVSTPQPPPPAQSSAARPAPGPATLPPETPPKSLGTQRSAGAAVIHHEIPKVPRSARQTIHGHIRVVVRVTVDRSGGVVDEVLIEPGPSRYFARLATEAARKWKFTPSDDPASRQWLVRFEFSREQTTGHALRPRPQ